jgi:peptidoglycan hydrolase-like protein with peptidoglycan-binding domain
MKRLLIAIFAASLCLSAGAAAQNSNTSTAASNANTTKKRGPVFRATKEQIKQAQAILKQRAFYAGEPTGKLDTPTRDGLKKYQEAEGLKVTGTLNAATLRKMNVALNDKQKEWVSAHSQS